MKIFLILSTLIFTQTHCPNNRIHISTPCYGECGSFIDDNSNGICDIWERYNNERKTKQILKEQKQPTHTQPKSYQQENVRKSHFLEKLLSNGVFHILIITLVIAIISEVFFSNSNAVRIIWNWILLLSMLISALSGYAIYFNFFEESKKFLYLIHLQSSTLLFVASIYHTIKRFKCMI